MVGTTARHLSFLETGRSRPSRRMVLRLGEALGVSLRERNELLHAAGLPAAYPESGMDGPDLPPFLAATDSLLNWADIAWASLGRLRQQRDQAPFGAELRELAALAETVLAALPRPDPPGTGLAVCPWFRVNGEVIKTIGVVARFDTASEVTLDGLRVELT